MILPGLSLLLLVNSYFILWDIFLLTSKLSNILSYYYSVMLINSCLVFKTLSYKFGKICGPGSGLTKGQSSLSSNSNYYSIHSYK